MLFQIQKELIQKNSALTISLNDVAKYKALKKEYGQLSSFKRQKLTNVLKTFLLMTAMAHEDIAFARQLVKENDYEKMNDFKANLALSRFYEKYEMGDKVIEYLLPLFENTPDKLESPYLYLLFKNLFLATQYPKCDLIFQHALNRYPENLNWKLEALLFQIKTNHLYPKDKQQTANNLAYLNKRCKSDNEFYQMALCFFEAGYFQEGVNALDISLQKLTVSESISESLSAFESEQCLLNINKIVDILEPLGIKPFPIAGSLLGLYRDGKFMEYDKDGDLGIFVTSYEEIFSITKIICQESEFVARDMISKSKNAQCWNIGIVDCHHSSSIDLFFFYRQPTQTEFGVYTPCGTLKWAFKPFELTRQMLAGKEYWLPENIEEHLVEMYGESWREPIEAWDSLLNCPNLTDDSQPVAIYYGLMRLWEALQKNKTKKALNYYQTLTTKWGMSFSAEAEANVRKLLGLSD